jgi:Concanavalin A-like lectin/glucanases superfamily
VGQTLTAANGDWAGSPTGYTYQWQDCTSYHDVVVSDSPISYWRLGEASSATTAVDQTAANPGTYVATSGLGAAGALAGDSDTADNLASGGYVTAADSAGLRPAAGFTVEAWVKTTATAGTVVAKPYTAGALQSYSLNVAAGKATVRVDTTAGSYVATSTASVNDGAWHLLDGTFDGSTLAIWVDGQQQETASTSGSLQYSALALSIGRFDSTAGQNLAGTVDEVALYPSALSAARVQAHQDAGANPSGASPCTDIAGATSVIYQLAAGDVGKRVRVVVTATNADGSTAANSPATVVLPGPPLNVASATVSGSPQPGQTLTAQPGSWTGTLPISFAYQWQDCANRDYRTSVLADAPAAYWRLDESSGSTAADQSGNNNPGAYSSVSLGAAGALSGDTDAAAGFNGSSSVVSSNYTKGNIFTAELWVRPATSTPPSGGATLVSHGGPSSGQSRGWEVLEQPDGSVLFWFPSGASVTSSTKLTDPSRWYDLVAVSTGSQLQLYVNGSQEASANGTQPIATGTPTLIGAYLSTSFFAGSIDELALYPTALSSTRIQAHYSAATTAPGCASISGASGQNYTVQSADVGQRIRAQVTASNTYGSFTTYTASTLVGNTAVPANTSPPTFSGTPTQGQTLTASPGTWSGTPPISYGYQWQHCATYNSTVTADSPAGLLAPGRDGIGDDRARSEWKRQHRHLHLRAARGAGSDQRRPGLGRGLQRLVELRVVELHQGERLHGRVVGAARQRDAAGKRVNTHLARRRHVRLEPGGAVGRKRAVPLPGRELGNEHDQADRPVPLVPPCCRLDGQPAAAVCERDDGGEHERDTATLGADSDLGRFVRRFELFRRHH